MIEETRGRKRVRVLPDDDRDAPLLTWCLWCDPLDWEDLRNLVARKIGGDVVDEVAPFKDRQAFKESGEEALSRLYAIMDRDTTGLEAVRRAVEIAHHILESIHDKRQVSADHISALNEILRVASQLIPYGNNNGSAPIEAFKENTFSKIVYAHFTIAQELRRLIIGVAGGSIVVARCADCNRVFEQTKRGQKFCTHRCSHRVGQKKATAGREKQRVFRP